MSCEVQYAVEVYNCNHSLPGLEHVAASTPYSWSGTLATGESFGSLPITRRTTAMTSVPLEQIVTA